jgi:hypothetical protein
MAALTSPPRAFTSLIVEARAMIGPLNRIMISVGAEMVDPLRGVEESK